MHNNPFSPHNPVAPRSFVDREREIDLIFDHIASTHRGNIALSSPLGVGKTSLLRYIADPEIGHAHGLEHSRNVVVYVDTQSVTPFGADRFWRRVARLASRDEPRLEAPTLGLLGRPEMDIIDLEEYLDGLADLGLGLILLLDEFEWALQSDSPAAAAESRNFLAQMASLARRSPRVLSLVVATQAPLTEATRVIEAWRGSPFATVFTSLVLRPLDRGGADRLLARALGRGPIQFTEDEVSRLYSMSSGHPAALQAAAFSLFHGRSRHLATEQLWAAVQTAVGNALVGATSDASPNGNAMAARGAETDLADTQARNAPAQGLWVDQITGEVSSNGRRVASLTALEYSLLRLLYGKPGSLCSKEDIIRQVWGEEFMGEVEDSRVEKLVSRLRRKIEPMPGRPQYIRTVRGRGYRYVP